MVLRSLLPIVALLLGVPSSAAAQPCPAGAGARCDALVVARDGERLAAQELVKSADGTRGERSRARYKRAGEAYLVVWQSYYADPCRGGEKEPCSRAEEVLYNAARALQAAGDLERASEVRRTLVDPQFHLEKTQLGLRSLYDEGSVQQSVAAYASAASFYERFAKASPKDEKAAAALLDAVVLRLSLHDRQTAEQDADLWAKNYAAKQPANHAKLAVAIAEAKRDAGADPREIEDYLKTRRDLVAKAGSEYQPAVDVMLGKATAARGDLTAAGAHFARAGAYDVEALVRALGSEERSTADRRLAKALIGIGEARLWLADQARDAAMKLSVEKNDLPSLAKKRAAILAAEKLYSKVLDIQPVPPPIQTVDAAARVARMRGQLWAQAHLALGSAAAELLLAEAKLSYRSCVEMSAKFQAWTPGSAACASWLERHYPAERPPLREIMPQPKWRASRLPLPRPLDDDGEEGLSVPTTLEGR